MHKQVKHTLHTRYKRGPLNWHASAIGCIERAMYTMSWTWGNPEFIGLWLALKVAGGWKRWQDKSIGRTIFNIFIIGNALSILYGTIGAKIIEWIKRSNLLALEIIPLTLVIGTLIIYLWARKKE